MNVLSLPNLLSLSRIPLAFFFLQDNPLLRVMAIVLAMISDGLDGFLARRYRLTSQFGSLLDPFTDKFFVLFVLSVLVAEQKLSHWEAAFFLCRDVSVFLYGLYLIACDKLFSYRFRSIWSGKVTTCMQFIFLIGLSFNIAIPFYGFVLFMVLGCLALIELFVRSHSQAY